MLADTNFAPAAAKELARQIESLEPSAAVLNSKGFGWQTGACLAAAITNGKPDIAELRANGVELKTAVNICTAIAARHARKNAALAVSVPPAPEPQPLNLKDIDRHSAMSLLHDLALQLDSGRGDITLLVRAGFSLGTAKELTTLINAARR